MGRGSCGSLGEAGPRAQNGRLPHSPRFAVFPRVSRVGKPYYSLMITPPSFLTTPGTPLARIIEAVTSLSLAFVLFGAGFALCCLPPTTDLLANANSNVAYSPYDKEALTSLAQTTRAYTVEGMDYTAYCREEVAAMGTLPDSTKDRMAQAAATWGFSDGTAQDFFADAQEKPVRAAQVAALMNDGLALSEDSVVHLDQVHQVVITALAAIGIALVLFIACIGHVAFHFGRRQAGTCLQGGALAILILFAIFLVWALVDFNSIFAWMHSLFFADGTWTFSAKSLLICMYPEGFWMGMGVTWLLTTCIACAIALGVGIRLKRNPSKRN